MSSHRSSNFSESENTCVVCFKIVDVFSVGVCDHPVCFECSTRMRVLCNQLECPICRRELPTVIFSKEIEPFSILKRVENPKLFEQRYGIYFSTPSLQRRYNHLLDHECFICRRLPNNTPFRTFHQLKDHMRRAHELFYCELCVLNLKIFSFERKCYTRVELAVHRRKGDPDNTSHRGHPLCEFCDTRFMDNDELFRHLRRDHLFCHFCDADGKHQYYNAYNDLRRHYIDEHYLCEEGECKHERFTSAFRTDIDLKAHYAAVHSKNLSRAANRQARTLELEFTLAPRVRPDGANSRGGRSYGPRYAERYNESNVATNLEYFVEPGGPEGGTYEIQPFNNPLNAENFPLLGAEANANTAVRTVSNVTITSKVNPLSEENFPTLGGGAGTNKQSAVTITRTTVRGQNGLERKRSNFPALGETSSNSSSLRLSVNGNKQDHPPSTKTPNLSIHVNHKSNGEITTRINQSTSNGQAVSVRPKTSSDAFPALSTSDLKVTQPQWVQPKSKKQQGPKENSKAAPAPNLPPSSLNDFPTLNKNEKDNSKKIASSSVWVNLNNFNSNTASKKNKLIAKSSKTIELAKPMPNDVVEPNDNKTKSSKKKTSKKNLSGDDVANTVNKININTGSDDEKKHTPNGIIKKRSELNLEVTEPNTIIGYVNDVTSASVTKPPPGFKLKPPPGLNNFSLGNDLVFTNSSGQSYQISTQQFFPPQNFKLRNQNLIEKFKVVFETTDAIQNFKTQSDLFRCGEISAEKYYEYCRCSMGNDFDSLFPELLILLPNIQRQQDLYGIYKNKSEEVNLEVCATCYQVVLKSDLRSHLSNHVLDNHFPVLNHTSENNVAWNMK